MSDLEERIDELIRKVDDLDRDPTELWERIILLYISDDPERWLFLISDLVKSE